MVDRFDGPPLMQPYKNGDFVRYSDYAELEAENERLASERDYWQSQHDERTRQLGQAAAEALSRTGAVKVKALVNSLLDLRDLIMRGKRCVTDTGPAVKPVIELAAVHILDDAANALEALSALEPAAPDVIAKGLLSDADAKAAKLGKFGHHPDPAIDFEIEVESLQARLIDAKGGISKLGTEPEAPVAVLADIERAMTFRVGGDPSAVRAKQMLRDLEADAKQAVQPAAPEGQQEAVAWQHIPNCGVDRESKMVHVTGKVFCDPCVAPLVAALNAASIETVASCCGHGHRPGVIVLRDGRELFIAKDFEEARKVDAAFPTDINGDARPAEQAVTEALSRIRDYADKPHADRYVIRNMAEDALKAAMEAGR